MSGLALCLESPKAVPVVGAAQRGRTDGPGRADRPEDPVHVHRHPQLPGVRDGGPLPRAQRRAPGPPPGHGGRLPALARAEQVPPRPQHLGLRAVAGEGPPVPLADAPGVRWGAGPGAVRGEARRRRRGLRPLRALRAAPGGRQRGGAGGVAGRGQRHLRPRERGALLARRGGLLGQPVRGGAHGTHGRPGGAVALRRGHLDQGPRPGAVPDPHRRPPDPGLGQPDLAVLGRPDGGGELDGRDPRGGRQRRHHRAGRR